MPWKRVFQVKAIFTCVEAIVFLIADPGIRETLNTQPLANFEYSQLFYGLIFLLGIGYWWVSQDISRNHAIVRVGIFAQSSIFAVLAYYTVFDHLHPLYWIAGVIDLIFAMLFITFIYRDARNQITSSEKQ